MKEFCCSLIGLNSTFLVVPQCEFTSREPQGSIRGFNVFQPETRFHFQSANQIARFSEHSSLYLLLHVNKHGRWTVHHSWRGRIEQDFIVPSASVANGKENRCQNQFDQVNSVQNITSNSVPFMALPNITNYGNITINYNIKNKKKLLKVFKRKKTIKEIIVNLKKKNL